MILSDFRDHILNLLWRTGDTQLIAEFPNLLLTADAELQTRLKGVQYRQKGGVIITNALSFQAPTNITRLHSVGPLYDDQNDLVLNERFRHVSYEEIMRRRGSSVVSLADVDWEPVYTLVNNETIELVGRYSDTSTFVLISFEYDGPFNGFLTRDNDAATFSLLDDGLMAIYTACVCKHCCIFLRDDERLPLFENQLAMLLDEHNADQMMFNDEGYKGSKQLPRAASVTSRRRGNHPLIR